MSPRARIAPAWAGKPSCSASARIAGASRASAPGDTCPSELALTNVRAVTPDETRAKRPVGSVAGIPST